MQGLSDAQLREKTQEFKDRLRDGAQLEDILVEAFAVQSLLDQLDLQQSDACRLPVRHL